MYVLRFNMLSRKLIASVSSNYHLGHLYLMLHNSMTKRLYDIMHAKCFAINFSQING